MKKLYQILIITMVMIAVFVQPTKGQTYEIIYLDSVSNGQHIPYCQNEYDSVKIVPPTTVTGIYWVPALTQHGDTLIAPNTYNGGITCFFDQGDKSVNIHPVYSLTIPTFTDTTICGLNTVNLDAGNYSSYGYNQYAWSNGSTAKVIIVGAGTYTVTVTNICGLSITHSATITEFNPNQPNLGPDITTCQGDYILLDPGTGYSDYLWFPESSMDSTLSPTISGSYVVQTTNAVGGCVDNDTILITFLQPFDNEQICIVTVDTVTWKNKVIWQKTSNVGTAGYKILKEISTGVYDSIGFVNYNDPGYFIDINSNPESHSDRYKISVIDTCGNESDGSYYHNTINLVVSVFGNTMGLVWTHYQTEDWSYTPSNYYIYRGTTPQTMQPLTMVTGNQYTYNDVGVYNLYYYMVGVQRNCNTGFAYSNYKSNGLDELSEVIQTGVNIFPNPTSKEIHLNINSEVFTVEILDIVGQVLITEKSKTTIDIQTLPAGTYFVKVKTGESEYQQKIIVY